MPAESKRSRSHRKDIDNDEHYLREVRKDPFMLCPKCENQFYRLTPDEFLDHAIGCKGDMHHA